MANILIVGCGYVGSALAKQYIQLGHEVWALQRHAVPIPGLKNIVQDITKVLQDELPLIDTVFYLIGADSSTEFAYQRAYVEGPLQLIKAIRAKGNCKIIFVSSTAVYGQTQGEWVDEDSLTLPQDFRGKILLNGENVVRESGFNYVIVRFGGIYGPDRSHLLTSMLEGTAHQTPLPIYTNRIHLHDCVGSLMHVASEDFKHKMCLGVDNEPALYNDVLDWLAMKIHVKMPSMSSTLSPRLARSHKRCRNRRLIESGYVMQYPSYREGYGEIIESMTHKK